MTTSYKSKSLVFFAVIIILVAISNVLITQLEIVDHKKQAIIVSSIIGVISIITFIVALKDLVVLEHKESTVNDKEKTNSINFKFLFILRIFILIIGGIIALYLLIYIAKQSINYDRLNDFNNTLTLIIFSFLIARFAYEENDKINKECEVKNVIDKNKRTFYKLTPTLIEDNKIKNYSSALDYAYGEKNVLNIALTGPYGSGKSSVWETYKNNKQSKGDEDWSNNNIIEVSLANFDKESIEEKKIKKKEHKEELLSKIEVQILNQILYQVDEKKIPNSKYQVKKRTNSLNFGQLTSNMYPWAMILLFVFYLTLESTLINLMVPFLNIKIASALKLGFSIIFLLFPGFILIKRLFKQNSFKLKNINFQGTNIEVENESKGSLFDRDLDEVVYIVRESGAHTIVFEDLDRFENTKLFTKLRELNYLSNIKTKKPIRFIYMISDDVFSSKERTKFFDFLIPIVPIMDTYNARGLFLKKFDLDIKKNYQPEKQVIERISIYIDEYRLLKNIFNEYSIYKNQIDGEDRLLSADKLLGIITYKNVFPSDFARLQINQGYIFNLFQRSDDLKSIKSKELYGKIRLLKEENEELKNWSINNEMELLSLFLPIEMSIGVPDNYKSPADIINHIVNNPESLFSYQRRNMSGKISGKEIISIIEKNQEYQRRKDLINNQTRNEKINQNEKLIRIYEEEKNDIISTNISELLMNLDKEKVNWFLKGEVLDDYSSKIIHNHYFPLIQYLVYNGILDEAYPEYMGYFHESSISKNDSIFIRSVIEGNYLDPEYKLDNVSAIKAQLSTADYNRPGILNNRLLDSILNKDKSSEFSMLMKMIERKEELLFIEQYLTIADIKSLRGFVEQLIRTLPEQIISFIDSSILTEQNKHNLILFTLDGSERESEYLYENNEFKEIIERKPKFIESQGDINWGKIFGSLKRLEIQFHDISLLNISKELWSKIEVNSTFYLTVENINSLIRALVSFKDESEEYIMENQLTILRNEQVLSKASERVSEKQTKYLIDYIIIIGEQNLFFTNVYEDLIEVCNSKIPIEIKQNYIVRNKTEITDLIHLKDKALWNLVFQTKTVVHSLSNVIEYYSAMKNSVDNELINYINEFDTNNLNNSLNEYDDSRLQGFLSTIINIPSLNMKNLKVFSDNCENELESLNENLDNAHIKILIDTGKVNMNKTNLEIIARDEKNMIKFIETKFDKFTNLLQDEDVLKYWQEIDEKILHSLIKRSNLLEEQLTDLISYYEKSISILEIEKRNESVISYIVTNNFDWNDIDEIFKVYKNFEYKKELISLFTNNEFIMNLKEKKVPSGFVEDCIKSDTLTKAKKAEIISLSIPSNERNDIKLWLTNFNSTRELSIIFDGRQPVLSNGIERQIALVLQEESYIGIGDTQNVDRVYPKKKVKEV